MVGTGDGEEVDGSVSSSEPLEIVTGHEGAHAEPDQVDGPSFFHVGFDVVMEFGGEVFEAFAAISGFEGGGEGFDAALLQRFLHRFEHGAGVPESVYEHHERSGLWGRVCAGRECQQAEKCDQDGEEGALECAPECAPEGELPGGLRRGVHVLRDSRGDDFEQCATGPDENGICHARRTGGGFGYALPALDVVGVDGVGLIVWCLAGVGAGEGRCGEGVVGR